MVLLAFGLAASEPAAAQERPPPNETRLIEVLRAAGFKRRGWSDADLGKAMGGNWLRVSRQVWGG